MELDMDASNPLAELKDIHLPAEPSVFPLALGWNILLAILAVAIIIGLIIFWIKKAKVKRFMLLNQFICEIENNSELTDNEIIEKISLIFKRIALAKFSSDNPQFINGEQWLDYLQKKTPKQNLKETELKYFANIYQKQYIENKAKFYADVRTWLRSIA